MAAMAAPKRSIGQKGTWRPVKRRRGECVRVRADRKERGVAEVQQAGHADHDVQAQRQEHEDAGVGEAVDPRRPGR